MSEQLRDVSLMGRLRSLSPLWIIGVLCALMAAHLLVRAPAFPYNPDSASYFEQARSLIQSGVALETPYGLNDAEKQASILFPIGYPVVLALFSLPGFDPADTALALSRISSLLLPVLLFVSFRRLLGAPQAALLAGLATLSPGVLMFATLGTPDLLALLLAIATIAIVLNARSRRWLVLGGLIAGSAYAVRNAHLALLLAIALFYGYQLAAQATQRRATIQDALAFFLGAALILVPVLLRNYLLFGAFNPYQMAPSTLSVLHNVRTFMQEAAYDVSGWRALGIFVGWSAAGAALFLGLAASAAWHLKRSWKQRSPAQGNAIVLCTTYAVIGACVVIAARSRYEWGEMINTRHTLQYTPFLWAALLATLPAHRQRWRTGFLAIAGLLLLATVLHLAYAAAPRDLLLRNQKSSAAMAAYEAGKEHFCASGNGVLASNWGYVFPILCGAAVRNIEMDASPCQPAEPCRAIPATTMQLAQQFSERSIQLGFFAGRGVEPEDFPLAPVEQMQLKRAGMQILQNDAHAIVLAHAPTTK